MDTSLQNVTKQAIFKPSANQEKWLDTALSMDSDEITDIAEACGLDRVNWYRWLKIPGFIEWFRSEWDRKLSAHAYKLDIVGMREAKRDPRYFEIMQKRVGNLPEGRETFGMAFQGGDKQFKVVVTRGELHE